MNRLAAQNIENAIVLIRDKPNGGAIIALSTKPAMEFARQGSRMLNIPSLGDKELKMFRALLIVLMQAAGFSAAAESAKFMDGAWYGKGTFQMGDQILSCDDIMMKFSGDEQTFVVREASMKCEGMDTQKFTEVDTFALDSNGELIFQKGIATQLAPGTKVGKVTGNRLTMLNPINATKVDDIDMRLSGDTLIYSQIAGAVGVRPDYALLAFLRKK